MRLFWRSSLDTFQYLPGIPRPWGLRAGDTAWLGAVTCLTSVLAQSNVSLWTLRGFRAIVTATSGIAEWL